MKKKRILIQYYISLFCKKFSFLNTLKKKKRTPQHIFVKNYYKKQGKTYRTKQLILKTDFFSKIQILKDNLHYIYGFWFIMLTMWIIFALLWPFFKVKHINIIKSDNITNMDISYMSVDYLRGRSIWFINKENIKQNLLKNQNNLENIEIHTQLPNKLQIQLKSYKPVFTTNLDTKNYFVLSNGTLVPHSENSELPHLNIFHQSSSQRFLSYKQLLEQKYIQVIANTIQELKKNLINIEIHTLSYFVQERELHIDIQNKNKLIFDINQNTDKQIKKLAIFNKELTPITQENIIYTDLRISNKIFYCLEENKNTCNKNLEYLYPVMD